MRDMDYALGIYEAEGLMPYLYAQIEIAHSENAGSLGRSIRNRVGKAFSRTRRIKSARSAPATGSARTTQAKVAKKSTVTISGVQWAIESGPRGGKYYINRNGNKIYLNRDATKRKR